MRAVLVVAAPRPEWWALGALRAAYTAPVLRWALRVAVVALRGPDELAPHRLADQRKPLSGPGPHLRPHEGCPSPVTCLDAARDDPAAAVENLRCAFLIRTLGVRGGSPTDANQSPIHFACRTVGIRVHPGTVRSMSANPAPVAHIQEAEFLDVAGAAAVLRISTKSIRRAIESGALQHYRFGRVIRIRRDDLDTWVAAHRVEPFDFRGRMI